MAETLAGWTASMGARLLSSTGEASEHGSGSLSPQASEHESSHEEHHHDVTDQGVGAVVFALALGVITRAYIMNFIKLPYTVQILVFGIGIGLVLEFTDFTRTLGTDLSISLDSVANMNPEIIFYALLPILIFESAFFTDVHIFLTQLWQVLVLAGPGVMIATILMASFSHYIFPYGWDWNTCLFFGAITSATDPVAVVALMKELGVSERLAVLIEGESLLNDGTSIVVFSVFFNAASGIGSTSAGFVFQQFIRLGLGGPVVGFLTGMIGSFAIGYILEDHLSEITLTVVVCFSSFLLAEATPIKVSGILSVVVAGLYMSLYGRPRISPSVQEPLHEFWSLWGYMANTVIFFLTGLDAATKAFGKDSIVDASDWGYLVLLWVACHIVRGFVIVLAYPVLKHGYGTNWQTMVVLSYAGLRGAVGLTLALIVQETSKDNENIAEEVGDKIMFMIAGLAIMTLLINGTTCGMLLSYFGMDRATKAQTEIFIRACSAVESKLEHVVEELKKDRFLGDAEWPVVWRYVPVLTSRVYWHRIRYGSVVLANGEDEEISHKASGGAGTGLLSRLPGRGGGARAGGRFAHLPPRLRATWQSYHRKFHVTDLVEKEGGVDRVVDDNLVTDYGNENYHALDNNTVHMPSTGMVHANGQGGGAAKGKKSGFRGLVSQMSGLGKPSSSLAGVSNSNGDVAGGYQQQQQQHQQPAANHQRRGSGGGGLDSSARGVRGPRTTGTGRVMLDDGDGLKSVMVPSLARGASHGALSSLDDHKAIVRPVFGGSQHGGSGPKRLLGNSSSAGRRSSIGAGTGPSFLRGAGAGNAPLGHGSMHRGLAAAAAAAKRDGGKSMSAEGARAAKEIEATKSGLSLAREQLKRVDDKLKAAVREAELAADGQVAREAEAAAAAGAAPPSLVAVTPISTQHETRAAAAAAAALERASSASGLGVSHGGGKPLAQQPQGGMRGRRGISNASRVSNASKISRSAQEHQEQLAEARLRFVAAVKANYQDNFRKGWLSDSGLRVLMGNADVQLDDGHLPLEEWNRLRESFTIPDYQLNMASALRYIPIIGQIVGGWIFKKLAFVFELASNFIAAHEDIDILELLPEGDAANQLARENLKQLDNASGTLGQQLPAFPEVARSLKTQVAARFLLAKHREFVHEMFLDGLMNEKEAEMTLHVNTEFKIKLDDHPYAEHLPPRAVMLAKVPFLKALSEEQLVRVVEDDSFCQEELHGSNVVLLRQSERVKHSGHNKGTAGWYYIVRGSVQMVTVSQEQDPTGPSATSTGERKGGHFMGGDGHTTAPGGFEGEAGSSLKIREHPLHAGAVFGMTDSMLGLPFRATYTTTSFVHLFFFDRNSFLFEALKSEDLNRSLWRTVGVSVLRKFYGFHCLRLQELQKMVQNAEFVDVMQDGVGVTTTQIEYKVEALRAKAASRVGKAGQSQSSSSLSDLSHGGDGHYARPDPYGTNDNDQDDGRIHIHQLKDNERGGIAKTLSNMGLYNMDRVTDETLAEAATMLTPHSSSSQTLKVVDVEPKRLVLLVKGQLLPRPPTNSHPGVEMHAAPCLLTDVSGRLVFTKDTKMFLIPLSVVEKSKKYTSARRTRLEKTAHRQDTIQDLNEHRLPGAKHVGHDDMMHIKQDALGVGGRTDLAARQALTRKHSEMAKRASETGFFDEDGAPIPQHTPEHPEEGDHADGNYAGGDGEAGVAPRKSFVMKRGWGGMKMVEVDEDGLPVAKSQLGSIMEERERASSIVSNSARDNDGTRNSGVGGGLASLRGRLGSASSIISTRVGRSSSASTWDGDEKEGEMQDGNSHRQRQPSDGEMWGLRGGRGRRGS